MVPVLSLLAVMVWIIVLVLYSILAIAIVISLLLKGVRPTKSLAWLLAVFTIPVGGMFLYFMLGRNRRKRQLFESRNLISRYRKRGVPEEEPASELPRVRTIIKTMTGFRPVSGNDVRLLRDGKETFDSIFSAMESARDYIHLQYYIFEEGELADRLLELFTAKRSEGVIIRLIYDSIGSLSLGKRYLRKLSAIGVMAHPFLPLRYGRYVSSLNYRNHRKIIIVDGKVGFTGGINISDKYLKGDPQLGKWHDMHIKLEGSVVFDLNAVFLGDWNVVSGELVEQIRIPDSGMEGKTNVQVLPDAPDDPFPTVEHLFLSLINSCRHKLYITNPYIIPSLPIQRALENAALSGVDVRLLLSEKADNVLVNWCVQSYFEALLAAGIRIFLYPEGFLHSKIIVADNEVATIGTANLDERSFQQNYEVNVVVYDREIAMELTEEFLADSSKSREVDRLEFGNRHWAVRLKQGAARMLSPLL